METQIQSIYNTKLYPHREPENISMNAIGQTTTDNKSYYTEEMKGMRSACGKTKSHCLTSAVKPLLIAFQVLGILPVSFHKECCKFTHSWISYVALHNFLFLIANIIGSIIVYTISSDVFGRFSGTDFVTISLTLIAQFGATILVFATGNFSASRFCKGRVTLTSLDIKSLIFAPINLLIEFLGWQILHDAAGELGVLEFGILKQYILFIPMCLLLDAIMKSAVLEAQTEELKRVFPPSVALLGSFIANFVPNFITFSFTVILWICGHFFDCVNEAIESCLDQPPREFFSMTNIGVYPLDHAEKLAKLRRIHEDICDAVRYLCSAFGFQLLVIFPATGFRLIAGIYAVMSNLIESSPNSIKSFIIFQGIASIIATFRIMLVIISSDFVMKKAKSTVRTLKRARCPSNSDELNQEIDVFLMQIGSFPLDIKCCNIITLNLTFLSTAIPNVVTYVLVLMQFKQGDANASVSQDTGNIICNSSINCG